MDLTTLDSIFTVLTQIGEFVVKYGPNLLTDGETIIADLKMAWTSAMSGVPLTAVQQAQVDTALDSANTALQAAITAQQAQT